MDAAVVGADKYSEPAALSRRDRRTHPAASSGGPAISLDSVLVPVSTGIRGVFRSFAGLLAHDAVGGRIHLRDDIDGTGTRRPASAAPLIPALPGYLQLTAVCAIVLAYFVEPGFYSIRDLVSAIRWLPSYWLLALYQQLNGSMHPALQPFATRAWIGLAGVLCVAPIAYALSCWRISAIADEPDITPLLRGGD
jgi:hypothetical protein